MEKINYVILKRAIRDFKSLIYEEIAPAVDGDKNFQDSQFLYLESLIKIFEMSPELSNLDYVNKLKEAFNISQKPKPFLLNRNEYKKQAGRLICSNAEQLILEAEKVAIEIRPKKDINKKDSMIQIIRKYLERRTALNEDVTNYGKTYAKIDEKSLEPYNLWDRFYKNHALNFVEILSDLKAQDPHIGI